MPLEFKVNDRVLILAERGPQGLAGSVALPTRILTAVDRDIQPADAFSRIYVNEDTNGADVTLTLDPVDDFAAAQTVQIKKSGKTKFTRIVVSGDDRFDDDGPTFAVTHTDIASNPDGIAGVAMTGETTPGAGDGSFTLTSTNSRFTAGDVGRTITVKEAGPLNAAVPPSPTNLVTTIAVFVGVNQVTLAARAVSTVSGGLARRHGVDSPSALSGTLPGIPGDSRIRLSLASQRISTTGRKMEVLAVAGTTEANGVWTIERESQGSHAQTTLYLEGSTYSNAYVSGGTATLLITEIVLQVQGEHVTLAADPATDRWYVVGDGTGRLNLDRDFLLGPQFSYVGGQVQPGQLPFMNFWWSALYRRMGAPTIVVTERYDPPEVQGCNIGQAVGASYPDGNGDGTGDAPTPAGEALLILHGSTWSGASPNPRSGAIAFEALEDGDDSNGGRVKISAARAGEGEADGNSPIQQINVEEATTMLAGAAQTTGKIGIVMTDTSTTLPNRPALFMRHLATTLNDDILRIHGPATSGYTGGGYNFWECRSNDGADVEGRHTSAGNIEIDGAVSSPAADFAEYSVPWSDGNPEKQDRRGMTVVQVRADNLDVVIWPGDRGHRKSFIRLFDSMPTGTPREAIWAPTTSNPAILGGAAPLHWKGKFETDPLGNPTREQAEWTTWTEYEIWNEAKRLDRPVISFREVNTYGLYADRAAPEELAAMPPDSDETLDQMRAMVRGAVEGDRGLYRGSSRLKWSAPPKRTMMWRKKLSEAFDPAVEYVPRAERADWFTAALSKVGDVWVRSDQTLHPSWAILEETDDAVLVSVFDARALTPRERRRG